MPKILLKTELAASAEDIWKAIGAFDSIAAWHPLAEMLGVEGEGTGALRRIRFKGMDGTLVERLEERSEREHVYAYSVLEGPLPVSNCRAQLRVLDNGDGTSTVEWSGFFEPKGASEFDAVCQIQAMVQSGLDNLNRLFGARR